MRVNGLKFVDILRISSAAVGRLSASNKCDASLAL